MLLLVALCSCGPLGGDESSESYTVAVRGAGMLAAVEIGLRSADGELFEQTLDIDGALEFTLDRDRASGFELYIASEEPVPCTFDERRQVVESTRTDALLVCLLADLQTAGPAAHMLDFWPGQRGYEIDVGALSESIELTPRTAVAEVSLRLTTSGGGLIELEDGETVAGLSRSDDPWTFLVEAEHGQSNWQQLYSLTVHRTGPLAHAGYVKSGDTAANNRFGYSLALARTGDRMVVGAPFADGGRAYLFVRDTRGAWRQRAVLQTPADGPIAGNDGPDARFGHAVAISGDGRVIAVSAPLADERADVSDSGAAYLFSCQGSGSCIATDRLVASDLSAGDQFGHSLALADTGARLLVGAPLSDSAVIDGGAAYFFERDDQTGWRFIDELLASNANSGDGFGWSVAMTDAGFAMAVGAFYEESGAPGVDGDDSDNGTPGAGAVYTFVLEGQNIVPEHYLKASNPGAGDNFGYSVALSSTGDTLAVAANQEDSAATGIDGDQSDNSASRSGAVYIFERVGKNLVQEAYIKAPNTDAADNFGYSIALSSRGDTLLVGAIGESGASTGVGPADADNERADSGALYGFTRTAGVWSDAFFAKGSASDAGDYFGWSVAMSGSGDVFAGGAWGESSGARGVGPWPEPTPDRLDHTDNSAMWAGAVHVFE